MHILIKSALPCYLVLTSRYNTVNPVPYDHIRPTLINPLKESTSISDSESLPSPCTSPPQARRHYGDSITSLGKASFMGEWRALPMERDVY